MHDLVADDVAADDVLADVVMGAGVLLRRARADALPVTLPIGPLKQGIKQEVHSENAKRQKRHECHIAAIPIDANILNRPRNTASADARKS